MANQIAVKNLQGLNDILDAEKLNYEKLEIYKTIAKSESLKQLISSLIESSKAHYGAVYNYLKSHQS